MSTVEREWRNRQTRTFEGRVGRLVRVQVPSLAPKNNRYHLVSVIFLCEILIFYNSDADCFIFLYSGSSLTFPRKTGLH